jgi:chromosome segregation ATPase
MSDTRAQAIAARLTAIAERLENLARWADEDVRENAKDLRKYQMGHPDQFVSPEEIEGWADLMDGAVADLRFLSAHVETLTQQVAELQASVRQHIADVAELDDECAALKQENARLTADYDKLLTSWAECKQLKTQAEQQRDAALAALRKFGKHRPDCDVVTCRTVTADFCTCGLDKAQGDKS